MENRKFVETFILALVVITLGINLWYIGTRMLNQETPIQQFHSYQIDCIDDSIKVYDNDRVVGTVKSQGALDSLIIDDNQ